MPDQVLVRDRFLRDSLPLRLGGIAADLARAGACSRNPANGEVIFNLIDESKWFIEWTAEDLDIDTASILIELQVQLARWQIGWERRWNDPQQRAEIGAQAKEWSDRLLDLSGLVT